MSNDPHPEPAVAATALDHTPPPRGPSRGATWLAELIGTYVLVLGGVGAALFAADFGASENGTSLLTLIHLVSIPIDNTSVNPARSIAAAIFGGALPFSQLWVFIVFPIVGALVAGLLHRVLLEGRD